MFEIIQLPYCYVVTDPLYWDVPAIIDGLPV